MSTKDTRDWRPIIFLAVLLFHIVIVLVVVRAARQPILPPKALDKSLVLLFLPNKVRPTADVVTPPRPAAAQPHLATSKARNSKPESAPDNATTILPDEQPAPKIGWDHEAQLAAQNAITNASKETAFRNLAALSPAQLGWVRKNHLEPAEPGIPWKYRRVEVAEGGFPIIHINDHCVVIPFLMMMVFCEIGHIEPKGDLFEHMRDPHSP